MVENQQIHPWLNTLSNVFLPLNTREFPIDYTVISTHYRPWDEENYLQNSFFLLFFPLKDDEMNKRKEGLYKKNNERKRLRNED